MKCQDEIFVFLSFVTLYLSKKNLVLAFVNPLTVIHFLMNFAIFALFGVHQLILGCSLVYGVAKLLGMSSRTKKKKKKKKCKYTCQ